MIDVFGGLITPDFYLILSLSSPVYQVETIYLALPCICIRNRSVVSSNPNGDNLTCSEDTYTVHVYTHVRT